MIGKTLQNLLEDKHINVNELCRRTGINNQTIYSIIRRDNTKIDFEVLLKICAALDVTFDYFFSEHVISKNFNYATKKLNTETTKYVSKFGNILRNLRLSAKLTQTELGEKLGIACSTVSMYERGEREPDFKTLETIAKFFNVSFNHLYGFQEKGKKINVGHIISVQRKKLNLTLEEIGRAVGVSKSTVKKWESGYIANIKRDKIAALAKILNINPMMLIDDSSISKSPSFEISDHEKELLLAYRANPEMQASIDKLLDISPTSVFFINKSSIG